MLDSWCQVLRRLPSERQKKGTLPYSNLEPSSSEKIWLFISDTLCDTLGEALSESFLQSPHESRFIQDAPKTCVCHASGPSLHVPVPKPARFLPDWSIWDALLIFASSALSTGRFHPHPRLGALRTAGCATGKGNLRIARDRSRRASTCPPRAPVARSASSFRPAGGPSFDNLISHIYSGLASSCHVRCVLLTGTYGLERRRQQNLEP